MSIGIPVAYIYYAMPVAYLILGLIITKLLIRYIVVNRDMPRLFLVLGWPIVVGFVVLVLTIMLIETSLRKILD